MASSQAQHIALLDQLQAEVDRVLEHTGRVFAAASKGSKSSATAHAVKLKKELPGAASRFHHALDQLENDLQLAKAVMRRDLAVARAAGSGVPQSQAVDVKVEDAVAPVAAAPEQTGREVEPLEPERIESDVPVLKEDVSAPETSPPDVPNEVDAKMIDYTPIATPHDLVSKTEPPDLKPAQGPPPSQDEKPEHHPSPAPQSPTDPFPTTEPTSPDFTTADLDSLFADPTTSTNGAGTTTNPSPPNFGLDDNNDDDQAGAGQDFDFGQFNAALEEEVVQSNNNDNDNDNDNLASLLPGLQDYADDQAMGDEEEPDFDALFAETESGPGMGGEAVGGSSQQQTDAEMDGWMFD